MMSDSDCGIIFMWSKFTGKLVNVSQSNKHVNWLQLHSAMSMVAYAGIDYDIKLWQPQMMIVKEAQSMISDAIKKAVSRSHPRSKN